MFKCYTCTQFPLRVTIFLNINALALILYNLIISIAQLQSSIDVRLNRNHCRDYKQHILWPKLQTVVLLDAVCDLSQNGGRVEYVNKCMKVLFIVFYHRVEQYKRVGRILQTSPANHTLAGGNFRSHASSAIL